MTKGRPQFVDVNILNAQEEWLFLGSTPDPIQYDRPLIPRALILGEATLEDIQAKRIDQRAVSAPLAHYFVKSPQACFSLEPLDPVTQETVSGPKILLYDEETDEFMFDEGLTVDLYNKITSYRDDEYLAELSVFRSKEK